MQSIYGDNKTPSWASGASNFDWNEASNFDWNKASNFDWNGAGKGIDWKSAFDVDKSGLWDKSFGRYNDPSQSYLNQTKNKLFDKAFQNRSNRDYGSQFGGSSQGGGDGVAAHSGEVLPGFGVYESGKMAPVVIHAPRKKGVFGDIGGLAGGLGTAFGIFGPLGMPIGAAIGGIADEFA